MQNCTNILFRWDFTAALDKYYLRSSSGPFDWYFSELAGVIKLIEDKFASFLNIENLQIKQESPFIFEDVQYHLHFNHESITSFEKEYSVLYEKYHRRIQKFCEMSKYPCCYIRAIRHNEEARFIVDHYKSILKVIKQLNNKSDIIFLYTPEISDQVSIQMIPGSYQIEAYKGDTIEELNNTFDSNIDLLSFLKSNASYETLCINETYNLKKNLRETKHQFNVMKKKYEILVKLINWNHALPFSDLPGKDIIIYGVGDIGKAFYERAKDQRDILMFIDEYIEEKEYRTIPIRKMDYLSVIHGQVVVVITVIGYEMISKKIKEMNPGLKVIYIEEIV